MSGTITQLSTGSSGNTQTAPSVGGTNAVWTNLSRSSTGTTNYDIFLSDLSTGASRNLTNTPTDLEFLEDIDGTNVVWIHNGPNMPSDVVVYDVSTGVATTIGGSSSAVRFDQPAIHGRYIVYVRSSGQLDIDGYDYALGLPFSTPVTNDAAAQARPRVSSEYIVYEDYNSGNADIFGYKISSQGPSFAIAASAADETMPDIDGSNVVWLESANNVDQIVAYNLTTGVTTRVTSAVSHKMQPRVSGTRVVWADDRNGNLDLYTYDLATGVEDLLVGGAGDQMVADIDGNRVVYSSNDSGFEQIYLYTITSGPPPSLLPEGCDPAKTDPADGSVTINKDALRPAYGSRTYGVVDGKTYWLCIENGTPTGTLRSSNFTLTNDGKTILTPSDFRPVANPPRWVAGRLFPDDGGKHGGPGVKHSWSAAALGASAATVTVTLRVGK